MRGKVKQVLDPNVYSFRMGKAQRLRAGGDLLFIATGLMSGRALDAAAVLETEGLEAGVLHVPTLKPFDHEAVAEAAAQCGRVVTLENHSIIGGLASAVCESLTLAGVSVRLARVGVPDRFLECGSTDYLSHKYGLSVPRIVDTARGLLQER